MVCTWNTIFEIFKFVRYRCRIPYKYFDHQTQTQTCGHEKNLYNSFKLVNLWGIRFDNSIKASDLSRGLDHHTPPSGDMNEVLQFEFCTSAEVDLLCGVERMPISPTQSTMWHQFGDDTYGEGTRDDTTVKVAFVDQDAAPYVNQDAFPYAAPYVNQDAFPYASAYVNQDAYPYPGAYVNQDAFPYASAYGNQDEGIGPFAFNASQPVEAIAIMSTEVDDTMPTAVLTSPKKSALRVVNATGTKAVRKPAVYKTEEAKRIVMQRNKIAAKKSRDIKAKEDKSKDDELARLRVQAAELWDFFSKVCPPQEVADYMAIKAQRPTGL